MHLTVQGAALRLGVSPHTVRRWTDSGFLPCTRTSGGHRRIKPEDIDELVHLIGGRNHLAARLACEHQLDTLTDAALLLAAPAAPGVFKDLARCTAALLDAHRCVISEVHPETGRCEVLAMWDAMGGGHSRAAPDPARRPLIARALTEGQPAVVNVGDQRAEPAEVALLRRDGDTCLVLVPVVDDGRVTGLLEVVDHQRERRVGRHELKVARAAAAQIAAALRSAAARADLRRRESRLETLKRGVTALAQGHGALTTPHDVAGVLGAAAALATEALDGVTCVASRGPASAGASAPRTAAQYAAAGAVRVLAVAAPSGREQVTLTLTLGRPAAEGEVELLSLLATLAAGAIATLPPG